MIGRGDPTRRGVAGRGFGSGRVVEPGGRLACEVRVADVACGLGRRQLARHRHHRSEEAQRGTGHRQVVQQREGLRLHRRGRGTGRLRPLLRPSRWTATRRWTTASGWSSTSRRVRRARRPSGSASSPDSSGFDDHTPGAPLPPGSRRLGSPRSAVESPARYGLACTRQGRVLNKVLALARECQDQVGAVGLTAARCDAGGTGPVVAGYPARPAGLGAVRGARRCVSRRRSGLGRVPRVSRRTTPYGQDYRVRRGGAPRPRAGHEPSSPTPSR